MDDFICNKLTEWGLSEYIHRFRAQRINRNNIYHLNDEDIKDLISEVGPRATLRMRLQQLKEEQNINQEADDSAAQSMEVEEAGASFQNDSRFGSYVCGWVTSDVTVQFSPSSSAKGKRKLDLKGEFSEGQQPKKQRDHEVQPNREEIILSNVKKIMGLVHEELQNQGNTELNDFLRKKIDCLETDKRELIGVFGRTGAGKSSLINAITGEKKLLPTADDGACTSVMIKVESNPNNSKYQADIKFITPEEWKDEVWSVKQFHDDTDQEQEEDKEDDDDEDDNEDDNDDDDDNDEDEDNEDDDDDKMLAVYGDGWKDETSEDLMDKKHFKTIPEFLEKKRKILTCDSAEDLSAAIVNYIRSHWDDGEGNNVTRCFWPLVKCVTIKVPNNDLLQHVTLVDLPGSGDRNKSRDKMWKEIVRDCSTVWIVADIDRAASDKEAWKILKNTCSLMGNGGQCQQIHFICTKSDDVGASDDDSSADVRGYILERNKKVKKKVELNFNKNKKIKEHFSDAHFKVFTVSSKEFVNSKHLKAEDTEIKELQHCLKVLNDCHSVTLNYVSGAKGILSLMKAANSTVGTTQNPAVCKDLEENLSRGLGKVIKPMDEAYKKFDKRLQQGVHKSQTSCKKTLKSILHPRGMKGSAFHKPLKCVVANGGIHKPKNKKEININMKLASYLTNGIDEDFRKTFPNGKHGPISGVINKFTLHTDGLTQKYKDVELQLKFLKTEEEKIQAKLSEIILKRKKTMYNSLTETIEKNMQECYEKAKVCTGKGSLKEMRDIIEKHVCDNTNMFDKAKDEMLKQLNDLKEEIRKTLQTLEESIEISLKTDNSIPDVAAELEKVEKYYDELEHHQI